MMSLNRLYKTLLLIFPIFSLLLADTPAWSVNPADYQYNGSATTKVYIDGSEVGSTSDLVAAFVDGEVRGVISGLALPPFLGGGFSFNIMIFSNEAGGETVSFQYYDSANDAVIELDETLVFTSDMVVGNATAPFVLNGISGGTTGGDDGGSSESCGDETTWSVNPASFQYNGSVTSKVFLNEAEVGTADDMLAAFVGDEIRGVVNGLALPPFLGGGFSFNIMIFSNEAAGEMVEFKFYQSSSNTVICLNETVDFVSDMVIGNAVNPFIFTGEIEVGNDIFGCTDASACNYDSDATVDDESCSFAEDNYDCGGNCTATLDCAGECGGSSELDECGICNGSGIPSGYCDCNGNIADCAGDCGGSASEDDCGICDGGNTFQDDCGVCFGDNSSCTGCTDENACNYDSDATISGSCEFAENNFDCGGNCIAELDCAGECGGTASFDCNDECGGGASIDECGICDGPGAIYECGCDDFPDGGAPDPGTIPENTLTVLEEDGIVNIYMHNTAPVGGFQFTVNGMSANGASGGSAQNSGFMVSASGSTVIGFSLTGATIGNGSGLLTSLSGSVTGELSMSNLVISDSIGGSLDFDYFDLSAGGGEICDCDGNLLDECGECGGDSSSCEDCYGVPNGSAQLDNCGSCDDDSSNDCVEDCNGVWGGSAYETTLCEDTDGDGLGNPGSEVIECVEGGRDITNGCDLAENTVFITSEGSVFYKSTDAIGGFQFSIDGATASSASGGDAGDAGFMISAAGSTVIGFSLTGATFGPGCGTLTNIAVSENPTSLSNLIFSDAIGGALNFTYYVESGTPNLVADCSDEHPDCGANFFDCAGECGGSAVVDECGDCGGDGIADGACDCEGNFPAENEDCDGSCLVDIDCNGECGGTAYEITLCEDTDGDGLGNPGSEVIECIEGGRDVTDGCDIAENTVFVTSTGSVLYNSTDAIGGFQFSIDGATASGASGGDAGTAGFMMSAAGSTVIGFSLTGATFGPGCGTLADLAISGNPTSLSNLIFSDAFGGSLGFTYHIEAGPDLVMDCSDEYPDCAANEFDCAGECGGSAVVDECGECGGNGIDEDACDCAGNVNDCAGECGGSAEVDECGDCGGDGIDEGACDCDGNITDCSGECGGAASLDDCGVCNGDGSSCDPVIDFSISGGTDGSVDIHLSTTTPVSGFQFDVNGMVFNSANAASGGSAEANGFMVSTSNGGSMVLGFSLTGSIIPVGDGLLTSLTGSFTDASACLSNVIVSQDAEGFLTLTGEGECVDTDAVAGCMDSDACNYNPNATLLGECDFDSCVGCMDSNACNYDADATMPADCEFADSGFDCNGDCIFGWDCAGECGGTSEFDDCDVCAGDNSSCSGCIDLLALNYDMEATLSDGSCEYPVYGCLDTSALNYDSNATHSNGDCDYPPEVGLSFGSIDAVNGTIEVFGSSDKDLSEISFSLSGATITGASGGSTDNMTVSVSSNSFSASGDIDDGSSLLTILTFTDGLGEFCFTSGNITSPGYDTVNLTLGGCSVFVGADGGVVTSDAAGVDIPAGAMSESENISVGDVTEELSEEVDNATGFEVEEMTAFTPFDIVFEEPVEISISYDDSRNNRDGEFLCYLEDANDTEWAIVDGATCTDGECIADVDSFGIFATCILVEDCNGDLGGFSFLDDCGECVGGETGLESEYSMDACGLCGGPGMIDWYVDADSDNLGFGDGVSFCSDNVPSGYVPNDIDVEPNCATNDTDECDLCGGGGPDNGFDCDGNCVADGGYDCMGECGGSSQNDDCGVCGGDNESCTDCSGDINGSAYTDGCDSCVGGNTGDEACASDCNGVDGGTAWIDACGECVDAGDISCEQGCDGNWSNDNSELVNDDCGVCGGDNSSCTGCVDDEACNYVPDATIGDDSCSYSEENYDCVGNCAIEVDCMGECGGNSSEDECGICNGPGASIWYEDSDGDGLGDMDASISSCSIEDGYVPNDDDDEPDCATNDTDDCGVCSGGNIDQDCNGDCFGDAVVDECGDCGGEGIADGACDCDGNVEDCAGDCGGSALLDDCGVCNGGNADQDCSGECFGTAEVDDCGVCGGGNTDQDCNGDCFGSAYHDDCDVCVGGNTGLEECGDPFTAVEIDLHGGANLISLYALPDDRSVGNIMASLEGIVTGVIGEGVAASPNPVLGWVGSLSEFEETSGYWVKVNADATLMVEDATPLDPSLEYNLHSGANLISFPYEGSVGIAEGLPDDMEGFVTGIIGEGVAASPNPVLGWVGSLIAFQGTKGYWMKMSADASFSFNIPDGLIRSSIPVEIQKSPIGVDFDQSTQQAFYFVEDIVLDGEPIQNGDWVMAYNGNVLVGAREWNGAYTDIPVMGYDSHIATAGYLENGETPTFKVIRETTGETFVLSGNLPVWTNNELYTVGVMENVVFPSTIVLNEAYPNPFNPSTNIEFGLSDDADVNVTVYDIAGREMAVLAQGQFSKGFHNVIWNAADQPSGIYFVTVSTQSETQTQKLMLIK